MLEELNFLWGPVTLMIVSGISAYVLNFFKSKKNEISDNTKYIASLHRDIQQIKRLLLIMAKLSDKEVDRLHPGTETNFEELVKDLLDKDVLGSKT
tara:strand:- start:1555 stop:1842 length:288 start_codon:yes stop_codon:yes gene_type:complete